MRIPRAIQKRRADLECGQDQETFNSLLDNTPYLIYVKDRDCRFVRTNQAMAAMLGERSEEIVEKTDFDFYSEETARPRFEEEQEIMQSYQSVVGQIQKLTFEFASCYWRHYVRTPFYIFPSEPFPAGIVRKGLFAAFILVEFCVSPKNTNLAIP